MIDYEKAYKEVLEAARQGKNIETIFPELTESEDERIRKELYKYFRDLQLSSDREFSPSISIDEILAWLEKQNKQYPYVPGWRVNCQDNKPKIKHSVLMFTTHGVAEGEYEGKDWTQYRWSCKVKDSEVLYWLHLSDLESLEKENHEFDWLEKQKHEYDEIWIPHVVERKAIEDYAYQCAYDLSNDWAKDNPTWEDVKTACKLGIRWCEEHRKTVEWSEEDEKWIDRACSLLNELNDLTHLTLEKIPHNVDEIIEHLKSIKPQSKQKWSEEDEDMLKETIYFINEFQKSNRCKDENDMQNSVTCENWLKSIKTQPHWKPTEEQMEAFEHFVRSIGESGYASPYDNNTKLIYSLLNDLKSL